MEQLGFRPVEWQRTFGYTLSCNETEVANMELSDTIDVAARPVLRLESLLVPEVLVLNDFPQSIIASVSLSLSDHVKVVWHQLAKMCLTDCSEHMHSGWS